MNAFPITFTNTEYDESLGVYQKWLHGDNTRQIDYIYSMAAFQQFENGKFIKYADYHKYAEYIYLSCMGIIKSTTDWHIRIYIDESLLNPLNSDSGLWKDRLQKLMLPRVQIICVKFPRYYITEYNCHKEFLPVMFRYLALFDPNLSVILFRDIDNIYTSQHQYFVDAWLKSGDPVSCYMNDKYVRQEIVDLTPTGAIYSDVYQKVILSGLLSIRKFTGSIYPVILWQSMFAYIEKVTDFTFDQKYIDYKYYKARFLYGFDELALTRILIPYVVESAMTIYTIPIKIYDIEFFKNLFENPYVATFMKKLSTPETISFVKDTIINSYWDMTSDTTGLTQYMLCILTNIYFGIIIGESQYSSSFVSMVKYKVMPNPLLMGIGLFTFKNFNKYNWYPLDGKNACGSNVVQKFLLTGQMITLDEWTAKSMIINPVPESPTPPNYGI